MDFDVAAREYIYHDRLVVVVSSVAITTPSFYKTQYPWDSVPTDIRLSSSRSLSYTGTSSQDTRILARYTLQ